MEVFMDILKFLSANKMSQADFASELETTGANVNKWVNGKGFPSYEMCRKILLMGMSVEDLFEVEYNSIHNLVEEKREPNEIKEDEFRLRWMKMMQEWNEQEH